MLCYFPLPQGWFLPQPGVLAQANLDSPFFQAIGTQLGVFLPSLIWAIVLLVGGWLIATVAAAVVKNLLKRTKIDDHLANRVMGQSPDRPVAVEKWVAALVYWIILLFAIVAAFNALNLAVVSEPLNNFLSEIFAYLPRIGGALLLLGAAWLVATLVKALVIQGLGRFNLDEQLTQQAGGEPGQAPFLVNETIGNVLYWFIFLLFVPLVLSALNLPGLLQPVEGLIDSFLQAIPRIITAAVVLAAGWFVARIVRGVVTNLLRATRADQLGTRLGLNSADHGGLSLSELVGTLAYVLILIPAAIAALNELNIEAISGPAVLMLERVLTYIPQVLMAGVVLAAFYFVGRFVATLVTDVLTSAGFNGIGTVLGLPELDRFADVPPATVPPTPLKNPSLTSPPPARTPSEIVGLLALVTIVLFGAVTATDILQFEALTDIVRAILRIGAQVLSGVVVFAVGLYLANLAFRLISATGGGGQTRILAQTARIAVLVLVGAMALQQMGVATDIVNLAFGLLTGGIAVAIAIAFGLGGREVAGEQLREWLQAFKQHR
ncbi:mechanosensitive ion channel [Nodosilinea sp. LEGE 07298]|nr:mechanosensitive ion channel [Nodosilinea sp. LEGE 07298]